MNISTDKVVTKKEIEDIGDAEKDILLVEARKRSIVRGLGAFLLITSVFLFLRIFLQLLGANPVSLFGGFVYLISGILLIPFVGMFPQFQDEPAQGVNNFDAVAVIALFSYLIIIPLAMAIAAMIAKMSKTKKQVRETVNEEKLIDTSKVETAIR